MEYWALIRLESKLRAEVRNNPFFQHSAKASLRAQCSNIPLSSMLTKIGKASIGILG